MWVSHLYLTVEYISENINGGNQVLTVTKLSSISVDFCLCSNNYEFRADLNFSSGGVTILLFGSRKLLLLL